ncbi:isochorismatase family protein [Haloechinothrix sp. LS1_15]|uniref:isochorismatase family protein n=1 Tax=Haloechinothrix sp. LS1_15 TaxID=2652248 RepID=UPI002945D5FA|nr:isochorismatase family protein [Haloechinothrix sp. LS1_15]MDV6011631.1 isochorismatase family protein [Haloechinothrix sp. LS1_15]
MSSIPQIEQYAMPTAAELPGNVARWELDPDRAVLLIHDMQEYFLRPFDPVPPLRDALVRHIARLRARCAALGVPIAYTVQPGGMTRTQRGLLHDFWGPGMGVSSEDRRVIDALTPGPDDWIFTKWRYSAFYHSDLARRIREEDRDQIVVCGVYAHVGVLMTTLDAFTRDIQPFLAADGIADFTAEYHRLALWYAAQRCAVVGTTDGLLGQLAAVGTADNAATAGMAGRIEEHRSAGRIAV